MKYFKVGLFLSILLFSFPTQVTAQNNKILNTKKTTKFKNSNSKDSSNYQIFQTEELKTPTPFKRRFAMVSEMPTTLGVKSFGIGTGLNIPWYMFFNPLQ